MTTQEWLTVGEAAERVHLNRKTLLRYIADGKLPAFTLPGGDFRIKPEDLEKLFTPIKPDGEE